MRKIINLNNEWIFTMNGEKTVVNLPHCWNSTDGNTKNYIRTKCCYEKMLSPSENNMFLCIEGANSVCEIVADGTKINTHKGGYSTFVTDLTPYIKNGCKLEIFVDNSDFEDVYPSTADFTFWGGLYRNVTLIETNECHFSFRDFSSEGVYATPKKENGEWSVEVKTLIENAKENYSLVCTIMDKENNVFSQKSICAKNENTVVIDCGNPILWNGLENPYLYTLICEIKNGDEVIDAVTTKIGFRTFYIDSEKGFFLNDNPIKLKGVSRHQDRQSMGNGITEKEHAEDLSLILEVGANSVRLAHYQQNKYFYDLCDEKGVLVWTEVPVISTFSYEKQENGKQQLQELIKQNYNHPCIFCWGIQNEITQGGTKDKRIPSCMRELNTLAKKLDSSRYTTCAQLSILDQNSPLNKFTDILGYNHYFGWYDFSFPFLNKWLDNYHRDFPHTKLCLSEYGAEGLVNLHAAPAVQGDYSEEYQCIFHENYLKAINSRDWLWGSYVWNMFDFGAANRREGGVVGKNNKGLVTYDRKIKKDSFYLYKAHWTTAPFVHICGERFSKRVAGQTDIKVYSTCKNVTLNVNGKEYSLTADKIFVFKDIDIILGENVICASADGCTHEIILWGQNEKEPSYSLTAEKSFVRNWAEKSDEEKKNYLSPDSTIKELINSKDAHIMVEGKLNKDYLEMPLLKLIAPMKIRTALKIAKIFGLSDNHCELLFEYTYAIHK